ncbi:hypothetical protein ML462_15350 [Gramella lutea]|uniref:Mannitol repressor n=1 Tax=Christiangramia lutea TaxID=1607951 RepID=A0A9X2ACW9_9FLAO|nr:hypothetical protein [Christiangramia lutea]MCH4824548.1 hypothetical protein [Christiangramia lutea]
MRTKEIKDKDFESILRTELEGINDLELMILKGHILIEYSLNKFIDDINEGNLDIDKTNFNFSSKIRIAEFLGLFKKKDHLKESIDDINKLRNQIAHQLKYDEKLMQKIIALYLKLNIPGSRISKEKNDIENFYFIIIVNCGLIMGKKLGQQKIKNFTTNTLQNLRSQNPKKFDLDFKNFNNQKTENE